jgi:hypothetical protein
MGLKTLMVSVRPPTQLLEALPRLLPILFFDRQLNTNNVSWKQPLVKQREIHGIDTCMALCSAGAGHRGCVHAVLFALGTSCNHAMSCNITPPRMCSSMNIPVRYLSIAGEAGHEDGPHVPANQQERQLRASVTSSKPSAIHPSLPAARAHAHARQRN